jgi:hypothetical protein
MGGGAGGPGGGRPGGGRFDVSYHRYGSHVLGPDGKPQPNDGGDDSALESGFYDGIDTSLPGIASLAPEVADKFRPLLEKIDQQIAEAQRLFDPAKPELTAPPLRLALSAVDSFLHELEDPNVNDLPPAETYNLLHELHIKRVQLNNALVLAYGVELDAKSDNPSIFAHNAAPTTADISVSVPHACALSRLWLQNAAGAAFQNEGAQARHSIELTEKPLREDLIAANKQNPFDTAFTGIVTKPYFYRKGIEQPIYDLLDPSLRDAPQSPPAFTTFAEVSCVGTKLQLGRVVHFAYEDKHRVDIVPNLDVLISPRVRVLPTGIQTFSITARDQSFGSRAYLTDLCAPAGCVSKRAQFGKDPRSFSYQIEVPKQLQDTKFEIRARGFSADQPSPVTNVEGSRSAGYPGLPYTTYYVPAITQVVPVDVTTAPNLNIAYLPGTGDDVSSALDQLGVHPHLISVANLTPESLKPYDAIILGVRAYEHRELATANSALNAYAAAGGTVIAQYNTGRLPAGTGPYPLDLGGSEKVVEEDAPVRILAPDNPLLTWPNKITTADFSGWVEERGHGFMATWDPHYTPLLETHDPGQQPQLGGLLVARTGKGLYIYCALALYRQLPEGVPGAYRLLANLISAGRSHAF